MTKYRAPLFLIACLLTISVSGFRAVAQDKQATVDPTRLMEEKKRSLEEKKRPLDQPKRKLQSEMTFKVLASKLNWEYSDARLVKGAPYSATAVTESIQTLADGNQISQRKQEDYYRDSEGRFRIDQQLETIGKWTADREPARIIMISDPVAGHSYTLDPRSRTALKASRGPLIQGEGERKQLGKFDPMEAKITKLNEKAATVSKDGAAQVQKPAPALKEQQSERKKVEFLGKQVIESVEVLATRATFTIPAGEIGNTLPIAIVEETWYSPDLKMMVMTKRSDPRSGERTWRLTNITRSEPAHSLFEVPADYTIMDNSRSDLNRKKITKPKR